MKRINWNYVALGILVIAYIFSALRFFSIEGYFSSAEQEGKDEVIIRVTHWQLEPGYREAMDWAIEQYNELPHVRTANVRLEQAAITEKVYNQFMNVHLISGTAPDIAAKGMTQLIKGNAVARYYAPLGEYINEPNPYNALQYLGPDVDPALAEYLSTAPWKDTFIDGMLGGYDQNLDNYYAVPISTWGSSRLYYNATILSEVKKIIRKAIVQQPQPQWLQSCWLTTDTKGMQTGYLPDNQRLREWLNTPQPPETLGQLLLYCEAVEAYAAQNNRPFLEPVSGSSYELNNLALNYQDAFLSGFTDLLEGEIGSGIDSFETFYGWDAGIWSFDSPAMKSYYEFSNIITKFLPPGFLGLDREQAQRRFILGNAALISSGGWDAAGIFAGATNRDNPEDVFEVKVTPPPMPAPDERWAQFLKYPKSEANFKTGVPLAINKQSPHFDQALDFLRFITSKPINEGLNQRAAWLSAIVGAENVEQMKPFAPIAEGAPPGDRLFFDQAIASIKTSWQGQSKLVMTGEISYDTYAERMNTLLNNPRTGMMNYWFRERQNTEDKSRARDRSISVENMELILEESPQAEIRQQSLFYDSLVNDEAIKIQSLWHELHPDEPFPN